MSDTTKTAAAELRAYAERFNHYQLSDWQGPGRRDEEVRTLIVLARHVLATVRADDDEPVTPEVVRGTAGG